MINKQNIKPGDILFHCRRGKVSFTPECADMEAIGGGGVSIFVEFNGSIVEVDLIALSLVDNWKEFPKI
jgi:hypothetical protein